MAPAENRKGIDMSNAASKSSPRNSRATKAQIKVPAVQMDEAFVPEKGQPYKTLKSERPVFSAYIIAAGVHAGILRLNKESVTHKPKGGNPDLFRAIVGSSAVGHWKKLDRFDGQRFTKDGINEMNSRLAGSGAYKTAPAIVRDLLDALTGKAVKIDGTEYKFGERIAISR